MASGSCKPEASDDVFFRFGNCGAISKRPVQSCLSYRDSQDEVRDGSPSSNGSQAAQDASIATFCRDFYADGEFQSAHGPFIA
jgi:hypothetical protein